MADNQNSPDDLDPGGKFLRALDSDPIRAEERYWTLRKKLVTYFSTRRASGPPDDLADEVLTRLMEKLSHGTEISDIEKYAFGVARMVSMESFYQTHRRELVDESEALQIGIAPEYEEEDEAARRMLLLERAVASLSVKNREIFTAYYSGKRDERDELAGKLGLSMNGLRLYVYRLRKQVEQFVIEGARSGPESHSS